MSARIMYFDFRYIQTTFLDCAVRLKLTSVTTSPEFVH